MLHCFLSMITYGIRTGAGFGFSVKSFNSPLYWSEFLFEWVFYFTIMLVMLNIINGIIVDTFQGQREESNELKRLKENSCLICSIQRGRFEAKGIDYSYHIETEHNIHNYFDYFLKIQNVKTLQEMSFIDHYVLGKLNQKLTDFFPSHSLSLKK